MRDKDPALRSLIRDADLGADLDFICLNEVSKISVGKDVVNVLDYLVFYHYTMPPDDQPIKANILLLHDQTNSSVIWSQIGTLQFFAAFGYRCIAPDLPGAGRTGGAPIADEARATFVDALVNALNMKEVILVGSSMAGRYIVPLLSQKRLRPNFYLSCLVAIAISDTHKIMQSSTSPYDIGMPCLVLRGSWDTSLGVNAADVLSQLPNSRVVIIPDGKHLCHQSHPHLFHKIMLNFLNVVDKNVTKKSIFVTEL